MDILFEFVGELVMEALFEISKSKRIPLWLRIPIIVLLSFVYLFLIALCIMIGIKALKTNILLGLLLIGFGIFLGISCFVIIWKKK